MKTSHLPGPNHEVGALSDTSKSELATLIERYDGRDPIAPHCVIGLFDVLRAHYLICDFFLEIGSGLFRPGPRDLGLLESAVGRQQAVFFGSVKWNTEIQKIASLFFGLVKDHPFHDANKRTAFLVALYAMHLCKYTPKISDKDFENFTVEIADGSHRKRHKFKSLLENNSDSDASVLYISEYFKSNFRKQDRTKYLVTFRELDQLLRRYGFELCNPYGNYIDVVRRQERRTLFGFGPKQIVNVKIANIGFPGWSKQVHGETIDHVRKITDLTHKKGVDSAAFFRGADPAAGLIARYQSALERLADR
jgi:death-on-curing protein